MRAPTLGAASDRRLATARGDARSVVVDCRGSLAVGGIEAGFASASRLLEDLFCEVDRVIKEPQQ